MEENLNQKRKDIVKKTGGVFFLFMIILTFFSSTINNFFHPRVSFENPASGMITKEISGSGLVRAKAVKELYTQTPMEVTKQYVKIGDKVKKGQPVVSLDTKKLLEQMQDETDVYEQKRLQLEKLDYSLSSEGLFQSEKEIASAKLKIEQTKRTLEQIKTVYEAGGESEKNLFDAQQSYDTACLEYNASVKAKGKETENNKRDREILKHEIEIQKRKIENLKRQAGMKIVTSTIDGIVLELNFSEGSMTDTSKPVYKIADCSKGFEFVAAIPAESSKYVSPGDKAYVTIASSKTGVIEGNITRITDNKDDKENKKDIAIDISSDGFSAGETGTVKIQKDLYESETTVPNSAIGKENNNRYFVYVIDERNGPMGDELFARKMIVAIGESDDVKTSVQKGISNWDKVITATNKELSDGMRILLDK